MYCGKNKTALGSQRQIAEALLALLREERLDDVSVSAVCRRAEVSRQTFYSLFQSKENVITFALRNDCGYPAEEHAEGHAEEECCASAREVCRGFSRYIIRHAELLELLAENEVMPLLRAVLREDFSRCTEIRACVRSSASEYAIDYMAAGITSVAETYIRLGRREDEEQLTEIISTLLQGGCFRV